ncbi:MAG: histone deacetylase [Planctomycetota bacterium]
MDIFYSDTFELPLPEKHRFPMSKYRLLRERIMATAKFSAAALKIPEPATDRQLQLVHDSDYVQRVVNGELSKLEIRRIGFPWSRGLVERSRRSVGASISAARSALTQRASVNLAGGTHHAFVDAGQGYCVFNDAAVAAKVLKAEGKIENTLVVDLDVHQGNGTAAIAKTDASLFSFSMHCEKNYPFRKTTSDIDISLPENTGDAEYLAALRSTLQTIERRFTADLVVFLAGADPFEGDRLGHLRLTKLGLKQRDQIVFDFCDRHQIPIAIAMSGGYAPDVNDIVDIHFQTVDLALEFHGANNNSGSAEFRQPS